MADTIYWREVLVFLRRIIHATDLQSKRVAKVSIFSIFMSAAPLPSIHEIPAVDEEVGNTV